MHNAHGMEGGKKSIVVQNKRNHHLRKMNDDNGRNKGKNLYKTGSDRLSSVNNSLNKGKNLDKTGSDRLSSVNNSLQ
jgi:hypothetical protein